MALRCQRNALRRARCAMPREAVDRPHGISSPVK